MDPFIYLFLSFSFWLEVLLFCEKGMVLRAGGITIWIQQHISWYAEAVARRCSVKKCFKNFCKISRKTPVPESLFLQAKPCKFIKKETLAQVFSREFCEISKNNFSCRTPPMAASGYDIQQYVTSITIATSEDKL